MPIKKLITLCFIVLICPALALAQNKKEDKRETRKWHGFGAEFRLGLSSGLLSFGHVGNIASEYRTVPVHPNDNRLFEGPIWGSRRQIIVPADTIDLKQNWANSDVSLALQFYFNDKIGLRTGVTSIGQLGRPTRVADYTANYRNTRGINQFGTDSRGAGTSLAYYSVTYGPEDIKYDKNDGFIYPLFYEVEYNPNSKVGFIMGYRAYSHDYTIENGYDRWNSFEVYRKYHLAHSRVHWPYFGLRLGDKGERNKNSDFLKGGVIIFAGPEIQILSVNPDVNIGADFRKIGFRVGISIFGSGSMLK